MRSDKHEKINAAAEKKMPLYRQLDWPLILIPLLCVVFLCVVFILYPARSAQITDAIRAFLGNQFGFFYILIGFVILCLTIYLAFSKYGKIRLGNLEKPEYSDFKWATMIFTGVFAADIIYYSFIEWALYAGESLFVIMCGVQ